MDVNDSPSNDCAIVCLYRWSLVFQSDHLHILLHICAVMSVLLFACIGGPGVHHSLARHLPALARMLDRSAALDTLHLIHRLDKETTGVILLAR